MRSLIRMKPPPWNAVNHLDAATEEADDENICPQVLENDCFVTDYGDQKIHLDRPFDELVQDSNAVVCDNRMLVNPALEESLTPNYELTENIRLNGIHSDGKYANGDLDNWNALPKPVVGLSQNNNKVPSNKPVKPFLRKNHGKKACDYKGKINEPKLINKFKTAAKANNGRTRQMADPSVVGKPTAGVRPIVTNACKQSTNSVRSAIPTNQHILQPTKSSMMDRPNLDEESLCDVEEFELLEKVAEGATDKFNRPPVDCSFSSIIQLNKEELRRRASQNIAGDKSGSIAFGNNDVMTDNGAYDRQFLNYGDEKPWDCSINDLSPEANTLTKYTSQDEHGRLLVDNETDDINIQKLASEIFPRFTEVQAHEIEASEIALKQLENVQLGQQLKNKADLLEFEIKRFQQENAAISRLRKELETEKKRLQAQCKELESVKDDETVRVEEEWRRLKRERKQFEERQERLRELPNRTERADTEALRQHLEALKRKHADKELRWQTSQESLRQQLHTVEMNRDDLQTTCRMLEEKRLDLLKQLTTQTMRQKDNNRTPTIDCVANELSAMTTGKPNEIAYRPAPIPVCGGNIENHTSVPYSEVVRPSSSSSRKLANTSKFNQKYMSTRNSGASDYYTGDEDLSVSSCGDKYCLDRPFFTSCNTGVDKANLEADRLMALLQRPYSQLPIASSQDFHQVGAALQQESANGVREITLKGGEKILEFANRSRKLMSTNGDTTVVLLYNGDIKKTLRDGREIYWFAHDRVTQIKHPDGAEENIHETMKGEPMSTSADCTISNTLPAFRRIIFPDGTVEVHTEKMITRYTSQNGSERIIHYRDTGIQVVIRADGTKEITFPDGQREIHANGEKVRIYPDGTTKTVFKDGRQETRYASGRVRMKDGQGTVVFDNVHSLSRPSSSSAVTATILK